jgi:hypothetical protein
MFKTTNAQDVNVGDVQMLMVEEKRKIVYDYYRAKKVFVGSIADAIYDLEGKYVGDRTINCVEIEWLPLTYVGKSHTTRYAMSATLDVATNVININDLVLEEDKTDD